MSCFFQLRGTDVWNPSNRVASLFVHQAWVISAELQKESGVSPIEEDECKLDSDAFTEFIRTLLAHYQDSNNPPLMSLTEGFIAICIVLLERSDNGVAEIGDRGYLSEYWEPRLAVLCRSMPR